MFELKTLHPDAIPAALAKAERYRLLNEPEQAASICQDILRAEPRHQQAVSLYLLAVTDGFRLRRSPDVWRARALLDLLDSEYERSYYAGIIDERQARAVLEHGGPLAAHEAYLGFRRAMDLYAQAEAIRPPGNDDAILRWNTCARVLMENTQLQPATDDGSEQRLE